MDVRDSLIAQLQDERAEAAARLADFEATRAAYAAARGDADTDDEHDPEGSTLAWEGAAAGASVEAARTHLAEIEAALARLDAGWDGACRSCGRPIPAERLAVRPSAQQCVPCASARR